MEGTEVVGLLGEWVGFFVGLTDGSLIAHDPAWHTPKGTELHGVESGKYSAGGHVPSLLHESVISQSFSFPHEHDSAGTCL